MTNSFRKVGHLCGELRPRTRGGVNDRRTARRISKHVLRLNRSIRYRLRDSGRWFIGVTKDKMFAGDLADIVKQKIGTVDNVNQL